jgi:DNA-binding PadR family transcriptional regulator
MRRGDVRFLLLAALLAGPAHGYELIRRLEEESGGRWRPSPGSVYPSLQLLEEEGLVRSTDEDGRKVYDLTGAGRLQADMSRLHDLIHGDGPSEAQHALRDALGQVRDAARQVGAVGTPSQIEQAAEILKGARQAMYLLLAND